jgi:hypothetical protein
MTMMVDHHTKSFHPIKNIQDNQSQENKTKLYDKHMQLKDIKIKTGG